MSLLVGFHIKEKILANNDIVKAVGNRVYPVVIPAGAPKYPFIVFKSDGIMPDGTKDGSCADSVNASVVVFSKDYTEAVVLANKVRYDLEDVSAKYQAFEVKDCKVEGSAEEFLLDIDAYAVTINFNLKTIDY